MFCPWLLGSCILNDLTMVSFCMNMFYHVIDLSIASEVMTMFLNYLTMVYHVSEHVSLPGS